jgi:hypothetical protein
MQYMLTLYLNREPRQLQTDGPLIMPSGRELYTLEQAWRNNEAFVSCIPDGSYLLEPWVSPTHGECYILSGGTVGKTTGVRTYILIHAANKVRELQGCIALGLGQRGDNLTNSATAIRLFMQEMAGQPAMLFISGVNDYE